MKKLWTKKSLVISLMIFTHLVFTVTWASADGGRRVRARLNGYEEVPAVSSTGRGNFSATIDDTAQTITYTLSYSDLEGITTTAAHIHFGQRGVAAGVSAFLCGGGGKPDCTPTAGIFTGVINAADVIGPTGQGIAPGEFNELVRAIRSGVSYVNVHTNKHPGGEIRGHIRGNDDGDDDN